MSDFKQAAIDAILEDLDFDSVKELRAYVSKNKQDDYFYGGILYAINAVQDLPSAQPELPSYVAEIEEEYQKAVKSPYIHKPLAKALYEVWKKHDREDAERRTDDLQ